MSNIFEEFKSGIFTIKVGGKDLKLKPMNEEKLKLQSVNKKIADLYKKESTPEIESQIEELNKEKMNLLKAAIKRANSSVTDDDVDNLLMAKQADIEEELGIKYNWYTKDMIEKLKKEHIKKLEGSVPL